MAKDVIARLKADTSEWDSKLSKAMQSLDRLGSDSIKMLGKMAATWLGVETAVKAFDKTISSSQTLTDEWGRTTEAATRVVESFFEQLTTGSFGNFLDGLKDTIRYARQAYDAIDTLGTHLDFNDRQMASFEKERATYRLNIRKGIDVEANKANLRDLQKREEDYLNTQAKLYRDAAQSEIESLLGGKTNARIAAKYINMGAEGQAKALEKVADIESRFMQKRLVKEAMYDPMTGTYAGERYVEREYWNPGFSAMKRMRDVLKLYGNMPSDKLSSFLIYQTNADRTEAAVKNKQREDLETLNFKGSSGSFTAQNFMLGNASAPSFGMTESMASLEEHQARALQAIKNATTAEALRAAEEALALIQQKIEAQPIALRLNVPVEEVDGIVQQMNDLSEKIRNDVSLIDTGNILPPSSTKGVVSDTKDIAKNVNAAASAFGTMGSAMQSIEDPGVRAAGLVAQAIASVASSFAMALGSEKNIWTWIAAAVAGTATMASTIATIKSNTAGSFADGGMVRGRAYAGDAVPIMANAGEIILNASQQQNLVGHLEPRSAYGESQPYVTGEKLVLGINNHLRRIGRGELLTTKP